MRGNKELTSYWDNGIWLEEWEGKLDSSNHNEIIHKESYSYWFPTLAS